MRVVSTVAAFLLSAGMAQAACSTANLAGSWSLLLDDDTICPVTIASTGAYSGKCTDFDEPPGDPQREINLSGKVALAASCKMTGNLTFQGFPTLTVRGRADAAPNLIVGLAVGRGGFTAMRN